MKRSKSCTSLTSHLLDGSCHAYECTLKRDDSQAKMRPQQESEAGLLLKHTDVVPGQSENTLNHIQTPKRVGTNPFLPDWEVSCHTDYSKEEVFQTWYPGASHHSKQTSSTFEITGEQNNISHLQLENHKLKSQISLLSNCFDKYCFTPAQRQHNDAAATARQYRSLLNRRFESAVMAYQLDIYKDRCTRGMINVFTAEKEKKSDDTDENKVKEELVNNIRMENVQLKTDKEYLKMEMESMNQHLENLNKKMNEWMKQSQQLMQNLTIRLERAFEQIHLLKVKTKPKKKWFMKLF